jgi:hypothetical protein
VRVDPLHLVAWIQKGLDPARAYGPYVKEGESMASGVLGKVLASKSDKFAGASPLPAGSIHRPLRASFR